MNSHRRLPLTALALAAAMAGAGSLAGPVAANPRGFDPSPWYALVAKVAGPLSPTSISKGTDGRLTILLVGSDWRLRLAGTGERTDAMMVITINNSGQISVISIPRDVGNVPIAPGTIFKPKVNGLFKYFKQTYGTRELALEHMRTAFAYALAIQIDYVAYIRFTGFEALVKEVGGVPTTVPYNIYDNRIVDERNTSLPKGAKFLASSTTVLLGNDAPLCHTMVPPINWDSPSVPNCTRALLYVRSRHGPGNNDWRRARRQQSFIYFAIRRVILRGNGANLDALLTAAVGNPVDFYTTLPHSPADVLYLYSLLSSATMPNQAVLQPSKYAETVPGTFKQQLKIDAVRALTKLWFGPLN